MSNISRKPLSLSGTGNDRFVWAALSFLVIGLLTYGSSLQNGFLMDDFPRVLENADFRTKGFAPFDPETLRNQVYLRPVTDFFNFTTFVFFGDKPVGYHLLSLLLYVLSGCALYRLLNLLFGRPVEAYLAVLFFLTHPINGVAVNYKNATSFPFLILAVHVALIKYLRYLADDNPRHNLIVSAVWLVLALFSHEVAVAFPLYLAAALYFGRGLSLKRTFIAALPPAGIVALFIVTRSLLLSAKANVVGNIAEFRIDFAGYLIHYTKLLAWYFGSYFYHDGIVLAWNAPLDPDAPWWWLAVLAAAVGITAWLFLNRRVPSAYRFGIAWMVIGCLPVALACFSRPFLGFVIQPHWLFFSSVGFFVCLGHLIGRCRIALRTCAAVILTVVFVLASQRQNTRWSSEHLYCTYWLSVSPDNFWPNFWLGHDYLSRGRYGLAQRYFLRAARTPYKQNVVLGNLGIIALKQEKFSLAEAYFMQVLEYDPRDAQTYYYLGHIYHKTRQYRAAIFFLNKALEIDRYLRSAAEELEQITGRPSKSPDRDLKNGRE
ncbi:MAG: glycosyltransferase family 39 protein [Candidatus Omnitrophica bacterium]|nr:glycosyltransferase family 39 protein [Candidatus Omnitrophota bacterium]MCB9720985.1 glycosyltransferase family 39 protein [Candidatus Omnitrophota bacterium]